MVLTNIHLHLLCFQCNIRFYRVLFSCLYHTFMIQQVSCWVCRGNVWNRLSGISMFDMETSSNMMKFPSLMLHGILWHDHIQWHPPLLRHFTKSSPYYRTRIYTDFGLVTKFQEASIDRLQRVRLTNRGWLQLVLSNLRLAFVLILRPIS